MPTKLTVHDLPTEDPEGKLIELIEGIPYERRSETFSHQSVLAALAMALRKHVEETRCRDIVAIGPLDVVLDDHNILQPDILFIDVKHTGIIREGRVFGAPDLCIEIVSEASRERDTVTKRAIYARNRVREYWIIDPLLKTATIYQLAIDAKKPFAELTEDDTLTSVQLPNLNLPLRYIFEESIK